MTKDQFKTLCARVSVDAEFREVFVKEPEKAAAKLGIKLSAKDAKMIKDSRNAVLAEGAKADTLLKDGSVTPLIIPIPALAPSE